MRYQLNHTRCQRKRTKEMEDLEDPSQRCGPNTHNTSLRCRASETIQHPTNFADEVESGTKLCVDPIFAFQKMSTSAKALNMKNYCESLSSSSTVLIMSGRVLQRALKSAKWNFCVFSRWVSIFCVLSNQTPSKLERWGQSNAPIPRI